MRRGKIVHSSSPKRPHKEEVRELYSIEKLKTLSL